MKAQLRGSNEMNGHNASLDLSKPTIESILLKSNGEIRLQEDSILAVVGPNNSGKTHFLKQLRSVLFGGRTLGINNDDGLIDSTRLRWPTNDPRKYLLDFAAQNFPKRESIFSLDLPFEVYGSSGNISERDIEELAARGDIFGPFVESFVRMDEPLSRISETERQSMENLESALVRLKSQDVAYKSVRQDFQFIFDEEIHFHPHNGKLNFFLGRPAVSMPSITEANSKEVYQFLENARTIDHQGLGMRNVVGLLLRLYTDSRSVILVDEPEAFLHPPQANRLGQVISQVCLHHKRQVICATHDRNLLSGLSKGEENQLVVQRLAFREARGSRYSSLTVDPVAFSDIRGKSRIRFTPILESLFASVAILVENEKDALFFETALESRWQRLPSQGARALRDSLIFIPTNGNSNFPSTANLLKDLRSPTVVVGDLDLVSDPKRLMNTARAMKSSDADKAGDLARRIGERFEQLYASEFAKFEKGVREGKIKKKVAEEIRLQHEDEVISSLVSELIVLLKHSRVLLIPDGELEDFGRDITNSRDKNEWVRLAIDEKVYERESVQEFCDSVIAAAFSAVENKE
ncbi:ATP-dependent endonuclease [Corynebacterium sp. p3-SID1056]|uniref:ATP-dependent nuclease n=1 Tax=Corynebacterium sp. p3-SID1056 TaxID=2916092 RepID=UPI0021A86703|nr:ATP-binding protein [Corynebacterium sp. p3-SID1056]MCT2338041.1 ATP-binding protein [Corynebacterium sp. p3-SID1056]